VCFVRSEIISFNPLAVIENDLCIFPVHFEMRQKNKHSGMGRGVTVTAHSCHGTVFFWLKYLLTMESFHCWCLPPLEASERGGVDWSPITSLVRMLWEKPECMLSAGMNSNLGPRGCSVIIYLLAIYFETLSVSQNIWRWVLGWV
jgi:hypothetical protein